VFGLVWDLRTPPKHILDKQRVRDGVLDVGMRDAQAARTGTLEAAALG
jgi:hypothetical protein